MEENKGSELLENALERSIVNHLAVFHNLPFLFVGSGLTRRYLGLPSWKELLSHCAQLCGKHIDYYLQSADGNLPAAASLIAEDYRVEWWKEENTERQKQWAGYSSSRQFPLKVAIAEYIGAKTEIKEEHFLEIMKLSEIKIDGVITTNYDQFLEGQFSEFEVFVGQDKLIFARTYGAAEVFKIHGCITDPESIVVTKEDYQRFEKRNAYLLAKILTIFVDNPMIFIGYSLSDDYIQRMFQSILDGLTREQIQAFSSRIMVIEYNPNKQVGELRDTTIQIGSIQMAVTLVQTSSFLEIFSALSRAKRRISAKDIRKLKEHIVELINTNDSKMEVLVKEFQFERSVEKVTEKPEIYAGISYSSNIGAADKGYDGAVGMMDLVDAVIVEKHPLDSRRVVEKTIPNLLKARSKNFPIYRFLSEVYGYDEGGNINLDHLPPSIVTKANQGKESFYPGSGYNIHYQEYKDYTFDQLTVATKDTYHFLIFLPFIAIAQDDYDKLGSFLVKQRIRYGEMKLSEQAYFKKMVCYYDWLVYRKR